MSAQRWSSPRALPRNETDAGRSRYSDRAPASDRRTGWLLAGITRTHLGLLLTWSLVVPTFRAPDEHVHHDLIRHLTTTWRYPDYDGLDVSRRTLDALGVTPAWRADAPPVPADAAIHRPDRPGWAELGPAVRNGPPNQMPQHPPLYYEATGAALRVLDGDGTAPLDRAVWQLRLLNVLLAAPLPLIAADVAHRFSRSGAVVVASAASVLAVPQLTHISAAVSNDALMIVLGSLTLAGAARLATGDRRWTTAVGTGAAAGLALFTKGFAVPLVPAVALACLLPLHPRWRRQLDRGGVLARAVVVAVVAFALGGWWWVRNVVVHGTPQPGVRLRDRVAGVEQDVVRFAGDWSERLVTSFWGSFGWFEARLPLPLSVALSALAIVAVVGACWRSWPRLVLVLPAVVAAAMVLSSGWGAFKKTGVSYATQGRYLFTGIVGLAVLAALGLARLARRRSWWQPVATLAVALGLQAAALWICLDRYYAGDDVVAEARAMVAFSPLPGWLTAGTVLAAAGVALMTLLLATVTTMRRLPTAVP